MRLHSAKIRIEEECSITFEAKLSEIVDDMETYINNNKSGNKSRDRLIAFQAKVKS